MKINWNPNPFWTTVDLDDRDKQMILLAYQNEEYTQILCNLDMELNGKYNRPELTDLEEIKKQVDKWGDICNLEVDSPTIMDYISYINEPHFGDCTCVPCSCIRCWVEGFLGIDTLQGLGKHQASKVLGAFGKEGNRPIDEAIASLEVSYSYETRNSVWDKYSREEYEMHIPRWESERETAIKWLKKYKEEHGF